MSMILDYLWQTPFRVRITHIRKQNPEDRYEGITHIKCEPTLLISQPSYTIEEAVSLTEQNKVQFYVQGNGDRELKTLVETSQKNGKKYLRTEPNDTREDNLLKLPSF